MCVLSFEWKRVVSMGSKSGDGICVVVTLLVGQTIVASSISYLINTHNSTCFHK